MTTAIDRPTAGALEHVLADTAVEGVRDALFDLELLVQFLRTLRGTVALTLEADHATVTATAEHTMIALGLTADRMQRLVEYMIGRVSLQEGAHGRAAER